VGFVEQGGELGAYTIPIRMRIAWLFNTERFESEGEFLRVTVDDALTGKHQSDSPSKVMRLRRGW
jgi:hypothetical protein